MATRVAARPRYSRLYLRRLGLWLFLLSEGFLFSALLAARYYLLGLERPEGLNQPLGLAITAVLLASSLTAYRAEAAIARGHRSLFARNTLATVGLGLLFLAGVGVEWAQAFAHFPPGRRVGTIFFTLTGMHALHVASGVALLAGVYLHGRRGRYGPHDYWPVEGAVKYWHFVDVVWVFIYPTLYLVTG
ncbi:MAG: cytochrome c oxidase subunit 3 [Armatimonadota bacterium]|nr:cytochrome c oxidase subunit 3 [Armatimonadota bacterium]MDR7437705.1 cytochrome c oxidase subunit 3 [Armatimonadota bacterium]MDR7472382.1 cytochrome c oxidase subunit 3 [Armatimonadota bacterium]MDR7507506.1 cytochrome c oxidase subunit 3 [Armatimonadota bacterium]MDR7509765.1 cytochrome c oxidase subunit 3 [Armatimonadota bacterium]